MIAEYEEEKSTAAAHANSNSTDNAAMEEELRLLQQQNTEFPSAVAIASLFDNHPSERPSEATVQDILLRQYAEEVLESYQDLAETHQTLEMVLERETQKLNVKKTFVEQQKSLFQSMKEKQAPAESLTQQITEGEETALEKAKKENQWIRQEFQYITRKLLDERESLAGAKRTETSTEDLRATKKKKRRLIDKKIKAFEKLVLDLIQRLLDTPDNPYLTLDETATDEEEIELLRKCGVIQYHPDNKTMIRLIDFRH